MTAFKSTARQPNVHWYTRDLQRNGFVDDLWKAGPDAIMGLYLPRKMLYALLDLDRGEITADEFAKIKAEHPPELTLRKVDEAKTLVGTYNHSHTCPPEVCG